MQDKITTMFILFFTAFLLVTSVEYVETANSIEQSKAIINQLLADEQNGSIVNLDIERMIKTGMLDNFVALHLDYDSIQDTRDDYPEDDLLVWRDSQVIAVAYITTDLTMVVEDSTDVIAYQ